MRITKMNESTHIDGRIFRIGQVVRGTGESEYNGEVGNIMEIRTGESKDTDNPHADIYVQFGYDEVILDPTELLIMSH